MKSGINKGVIMKYIKFVLITLIVICFSTNLWADVYPAPINFSASQGAEDEVTINWDAPSPPEFGEGFESGMMPPQDWAVETTNDEYTWQIMNNPNYVHSGSYSACVPWTYEENSQDEWLISPAYEVNSGDELIFYLGTSKTYGSNSPVYVLASEDNFTTQDTLMVCDGQNLDDKWEYKEYSTTLNDYSSEIQIAFQYYGGNGDLVCLDDVVISSTKLDVASFFVVPKNDIRTTSIKSRAPLNKKSRSIVLSGYKLYKKLYVDDNFQQIPDQSTVLTDPAYVDENVYTDSAYIYKARAIYNNTIPSTNYSDADTGYIYDENKPAKPSDIRTGTNWTAENGLTFKWANPYSFDVEYFNIYNDEYFLTHIKFDPTKDNYSIKFTADPDEENEYQLNNEIYNLTVTSVDFNGNESEINPGDVQTNAPAPQIGISTDMFFNQITIQKWYETQECSIDDNIKLYRSTDDKISTFSLLKDFSDASATEYFEDGILVYPDYNASTDSAYFYFATLEYPEYGTSDTSHIWPENTPEYEVESISNVEYEVYKDRIDFSWDEPSTDSLRYAGVYCYRGDGGGTPADTVYRGTTTYTYNIQSPGVTNFTFWPFDKWGTRGTADMKTTIEHLLFKVDYVNICQDTSKNVENFSDGIDPLWSQINKGDEDATWHANESGASQWFPVEAEEGAYGWINDDVLGNNNHSNCYLAMPAVVGLDNDDKVYLKFDSFFSDEYDGSASIAINVGGSWKDVFSMTEHEDFESENKWRWLTYTLNIGSFLQQSQIDSFQIAFHFNDNETWSSGWAIDNVSLMSTSEPEVPAKLKLNENNQFFQANAYPNPTPENINISFYLKEKSPVSLEIFNILGQKIATVVKDNTFSQGMNQLNWNGIDDKGAKVGSGIYFYRLKIDEKVKTSKFMMMK